MSANPHLTEVLADVLAAVCAHLDLTECVPALLPVLRRWLPVGAILVRRYDPERSHLETAGVAGLEGVLGRRTGLPTPRRQDFARWAAEGGVHHWFDRDETSIGRMLVPEEATGPVSAGALSTGGETTGVVVWTGDLRAHEATLAALLDAFSTALANDARLHELTKLREAAELDRQALLERLGRQDVSGAIVGADAGLKEVMRRVEQVAPTDAPVLILGETGAGKEVVARAIHERSPRARGPYLRVNCGAIPTELVDSELFGHEKGSFTGAIAQRLGWFERGDGGTVFLDEVAELPPAAQVRLLRVLQDGTYQRVGGQQPRSCDVRILAATHRDMTSMVADGRFRRDLWYRISVFPLLLPALRDRRGDIPALASHFAARVGTRLFGRPLVPSASDVALLQDYDWPGNVRELAAVVERAAILGEGVRLDVTTALGAIPSRGVPPHPAAASDKRVIEDALRKTLGRIEGPFGAAAALGVNPHTLRSRMRKLGIDWSRFRGRGVSFSEAQ